MSKTHPVFECYNVRTACLQLSLSENDATEYNGNKKETLVFLTMAPTIDKNISMDVVRRGGTKLFDYNNKIVMKLEKHELAALAKLRQPFFIKRYATPALDHQGQPKKDVRGNAMMNVDVFVHADNKKGTSTTLTIGANQQDETGCFVSTYFKGGQGYKNNIVYLNTNQTQELAIAAEWCLYKIHETTSYERTQQNKDNNYQQNNSYPQNNNYSQNNPYPEAPRQQTQAPAQNTLPPVSDIDDMLK